MTLNDSTMESLLVHNALASNEPLKLLRKERGRVDLQNFQSCGPFLSRSLHRPKAVQCLVEQM